MKFSWDVRKTILAVMLTVFIASFFWPGSMAGYEKICSADEDCAFVRTVCCPGCDSGIDSVNIRFSEKINAEMEQRCENITCPPLFCVSDYGSAFVSEPACIRGTCSSVSRLECSAVCAYYDRAEKHPFNLYLKNTAEYEGLSIIKLAEKCGC